MATKYYVSGGASAWNNTNSWSLTTGGIGGVGIPTAADDVVFDTSSPATCLIATTSAACLSFHASTYTGTLTITSIPLTASGAVTLGTGLITTGTGSFRVTGGTTITSNGHIVGCPFVFFFTFTSAVTLADNWTFAALCSTGSSVSSLTQSINGNNIFCQAGFTFNTLTSNGATITQGTTLINLTGTGSLTCNTGFLKSSVKINAGAGTVTFVGSTFQYNTGTWTYTSGNMAGGITMFVNASTTFDMSATNITPFPMVVSGGTTCTITLLSDMYLLNGTAWGPGTITMNGFTLYIVGGSFRNQVAGAISTGTTNIVISGLNSSSSTGLQAVGTIRQNVTINSPGTVTLNDINYGVGTFTYTAGTMITTGTTFSVVANCTMSPAGINFADFILSAGTATLNNNLSILGTLSFGTGAVAFAGTGVFTCATMALTSTNIFAGGLTLVAGQTYTITNAMNILASSTPLPFNLKSSIGGTRAKLTLNYGASQNSGPITATDIDSSLGQTIWTWNGIPSNTLNWKVLNASSMQSSSTFVN